MQPGSPRLAPILEVSLFSDHHVKMIPVSSSHHVVFEQYPILLCLISSLSSEPSNPLYESSIEVFCCLKLRDWG